MRQVFTFFLILISMSGANAVDFGLVSVNDTVNFPLVCMDTLGRNAAPDSVHVITWYHGEGANDSTYSARSASPLSTSYVDSVYMAGASYYFFKDIVSDLDASKGNGPYSGVVALWSQGYPTYNNFSFIKVADEARDLANYLIAVKDSIENQDNWIAQQPEVANIDGWNPITDNDSLVIDNSSFSSAAPDVNVASVDSGALESVDFEDYFLKNSKIDSGAISEAKIANAAFDSAKFSDDYWYAVSNTGGSASVPDSVAARIDSILASLGYDASTDAHEKIDNLSLSGGGSEPETLIVMSSPDSTLIEGASVVVRTLDQSTVKVDGLLTDQNGRRLLELDPDSFFVALTHNNYGLTLDTIVVLSGGGTDTLWMTEFDPGQPSSPDLCRVYGWIYDISGNAVELTDVTVEIPSKHYPLKYNGIIITPFRKTTESDSTGYWYIDLFPNQLLSKSDSEYLFTIEYPSGVIFKTKTAVPDSSSWQLE
ncbi:MAG: hypothetical protein JSW64_12095 [Candidatus Zixiibacteriota bacterium]|nr:MAG: hypothetical protein JSW64_12095 [candidate division Zixibacteria bacterium]